MINDKRAWIVQPLDQAWSTEHSFCFSNWFRSSSMKQKSCIVNNKQAWIAQPLDQAWSTERSFCFSNWFRSSSIKEKNCIVNNKRAWIVQPLDQVWSMERSFDFNGRFCGVGGLNPTEGHNSIFCYDLFSFRSNLVFACLLFCKTNIVFLTSIIHTINHAK